MHPEPRNLRPLPVIAAGSAVLLAFCSPTGASLAANPASETVGIDNDGALRIVP